MSTAITTAAAAHNSSQPLYRVPQQHRARIFARIAHFLAESRRDETPSGVSQLGYDQARDFEAPLLYPHLEEQAHFREMARDLSAIALSCSVLRAAAQEALFRAPLLSDADKLLAVHDTLREPQCAVWRPHRAIFQFVRTLLARPDLAAMVHELRIEIASCHHITQRPSLVPAAQPPVPFAAEDIEAVRDIVIRSNFSPERKTAWFFDLGQFFTGPWAGVALALCPKLACLSLTSGMMSRWRRADGANVFALLFGGFFLADPDFYACIGVSSTLLLSLAGIDSIAGLHHLSALRLQLPAPVGLFGLDLLPNIKNLDLSVFPLGSKHTRARRLTEARTLAGSLCRPSAPQVYTPRSLACLRHITHLSLNVKYADLDSRAADFIDSLAPLIPGLASLTHLALYGEPETHTYTSGALARLHWPFPHDHTGLPDLVKMLRPVFAQLQALVLPGGFWTLAHGAFKTDALELGRGGRFAMDSLTHLCVPAEALLGIEREVCSANDATWFAETEGECGWWDETCHPRADEAIPDLGDPLVGIGRLRPYVNEEDDEEMADASSYYGEERYHDDAGEMSDGEWERRMSYRPGIEIGVDVLLPRSLQYLTIMQVYPSQKLLTLLRDVFWKNLVWFPELRGVEIRLAGDVEAVVGPWDVVAFLREVRGLAEGSGCLVMVVGGGAGLCSGERWCGGGWLWEY